MKVLSIILPLFALLASVPFASSTNSPRWQRRSYSADDRRIYYEGRWDLTSEEDLTVGTTGWGCAAAHFQVEAFRDSPQAFKVSLMAVSTRVSVRVTRFDGMVVHEDIIDQDPSNPIEYQIRLPQHGRYTVTFRKLGQAAPFGLGIGLELAGAGRLDILGVQTREGVELMKFQPTTTKKIGFIGASDMAGFCVDGPPELTAQDVQFNPFDVSSCESSLPGLLSAEFNAEMSVQASSGLGLTQNALGSVDSSLLGDVQMPELYPRLIPTQEQPLFDLSSFQADLFVISLGGNDFNNNPVSTPDSATFSAAYEEFLLQVLEPYPLNPPTLVSICGQGSPEELLNPVNNRCRPCPFVEEAALGFKQKYPQFNTEYIFVPCDGSVVTGVDDLGCDAHKNALGQSKVADFLIPQLKMMMNW